MTTAAVEIRAGKWIEPPQIWLKLSFIYADESSSLMSCLMLECSRHLCWSSTLADGLIIFILIRRTFFFAENCGKYGCVRFRSASQHYGTAELSLWTEFRRILFNNRISFSLNFLFIGRGQSPESICHISRKWYGRKWKFYDNIFMSISARLLRRNKKEFCRNWECRQVRVLL